MTINNQEASLIEEYFDRLWPLPRSITGDGVRKSHGIIEELCPLQRYEIPSGTEVLDWTVPKEWRVNSAFVVGPDGKRILDFEENNLNLLNYSIAYQGVLSRVKLDDHLYSIPEQPDAIPYRTSYYKPKWGFCLPENQRKALPDGDYQVEVNTEHFDGSLTLSEAVIPGDSDEEILFCSYTCHPSLAINELSGPLLTAFLYRRIAAWKNHRFTYRFLFAPETVGAICYLDMRGDLLKEKLQAGYVITCVGDDGDFRLKRSKRGNTSADRAAEYVLEQEGRPHKVIDFTPSGSDERQFCSIGYNLSFASLSRTAYGQYSEYHTSFDNKDLMNFQAMTQTLDAYEEIAKTIEMNLIFENQKIYGEPQMSKYGDLYKSKNHSMGSDETIALKWLIHYADGQRDLLEISKMSGLSVVLLNQVGTALVEAGIFKAVGN